MGRTNLWYKVDVRLSDKFEVLHIAKAWDQFKRMCWITTKVWSISLLIFQRDKESFRMDPCLSQ